MPKIELLKPLKRIRIKINSNLYPWEALIETLREFKDICEWETNKRNGDIELLLIVKEDIDLEELTNEFMNHLLARGKELVI